MYLNKQGRLRNKSRRFLLSEHKEIYVWYVILGGGIYWDNIIDNMFSSSDNFNV